MLQALPIYGVLVRYFIILIFFFVVNKKIQLGLMGRNQVKKIKADST
mgnify:CR=1 FL=1